MKKRNLIQLCISIGLIPLWGLGLLAHETATNCTVLLVFLITLLGGIYVPVIQYKDFKSRVCFLAGPSFYFISGVVINPISLTIQNPISHIYVMLIIAVFAPIKRAILSVFIIIFSLSYVFLIYSGEKNNAQSVQKHPIEQIANQRLSGFQFLNSRLDTISLVIQKDAAILLETWNEACQICIKSIQALQDTLANLEHIEYYYLYQNKNIGNPNPNRVFNFIHIKHNDKILIDINNALYDSLNLTAYPYFLMFKSDSLVFYQRGYNHQLKLDLLDTIIRLAQPVDQEISTIEQ
jgi:hypothetical protein